MASVRDRAWTDYCICTANRSAAHRRASLKPVSCCNHTDVCGLSVTRSSRCRVRSVSGLPPAHGRVFAPHRRPISSGHPHLRPLSSRNALTTRTHFLCHLPSGARSAHQSGVPNGAATWRAAHRIGGRFALRAVPQPKCRRSHKRPRADARSRTLAMEGAAPIGHCRRSATVKRITLGRSIQRDLPVVPRWIRRNRCRARPGYGLWSR